MNGYFVREQYLKQLRAGRDDTDVIKVITGMRRSGKSVLLQMYADELKASGVPEEDILLVNLEDFEYMDIRSTADLNKLLSGHVRRDRVTYFLLDEIQNVEGWELSLSGLNAAGTCDVYVTGSNSDMLSSQLATHIAGRHVEIRIYPLSFREFMGMHGIDDKEKAFDEYLKHGGLPAIDLTRDERYTMDYLQAIYNTIVVKDVIRQTKSTDPTKVDLISRFLLSNIGNITNNSSIAKATGLPNSTVGFYMKAMEESFLFIPCDRYDMVGKKVLSSNRKYYVTDLGIRRAILNVSAGRDISRPLENIVFIELLRRGYDVRIGCYRDTEVDFLASRHDSVEYFQVCQTLMSEDTLKRETRSLLSPRDNFPKTILTLDRFGLGNQDGIMIINVLDWLLGAE